VPVRHARHGVLPRRRVLRGSLCTVRAIGLTPRAFVRAATSGPGVLQGGEHVATTARMCDPQQRPYAPATVPRTSKTIATMGNFARDQPVNNGRQLSYVTPRLRSAAHGRVDSAARQSIFGMRPINAGITVACNVTGNPTLALSTILTNPSNVMPRRKKMRLTLASRYVFRFRFTPAPPAPTARISRHIPSRTRTLAHRPHGATS